MIQRRVQREITGADWIVNSHRVLKQEYGAELAQRVIVEKMIGYQKENIPVHEWEITDSRAQFFQLKDLRVEDFMSTSIFSVHEDDSIELARNMLTWKNIHHLPVEDDEGDLVGLITDGMLKRQPEEQPDVKLSKDLMIKDLVVVHAHDSLESAKKTMNEKMVSGVPVVFEKKLVGILTNRDF